MPTVRVDQLDEPVRRVGGLRGNREMDTVAKVAEGMWKYLKKGRGSLSEVRVVRFEPPDGNSELGTAPRTSDLEPRTSTFPTSPHP